MGKFIQFVLLVGGMLIAMSGKTLAAEEMAAGEGTDKKVSVSVQVVDKEGNALATGKVTVKHSDAQAETNEESFPSGSARATRWSSFILASGSGKSPCGTLPTSGL